jgi:hypothetical protein
MVYYKEKNVLLQPFRYFCSVAYKYRLNTKSFRYVFMHNNRESMFACDKVGVKWNEQNFFIMSDIKMSKCVMSTNLYSF